MDILESVPPNVGFVLLDPLKPIINRTGVSRSEKLLGNELVVLRRKQMPVGFEMVSFV